MVLEIFVIIFLVLLLSISIIYCGVDEAGVELCFWRLVLVVVLV